MPNATENPICSRMLYLILVVFFYVVFLPLNCYDNCAFSTLAVAWCFVWFLLVLTLKTALIELVSVVFSARDAMPGDALIKPGNALRRRYIGARNQARTPEIQMLI